MGRLRAYLRNKLINYWSIKFSQMENSGFSEELNLRMLFLILRVEYNFQKYESLLDNSSITDVVRHVNKTLTDQSKRTYVGYAWS